MKITQSMEIAAPADEVWQIVGPGFADVGDWASQIPRSHAVAAVERDDHAPVEGRVCAVATPGFDTLTEQLTHYDDITRTFTYRAAAGMPAIVTEAYNTWSVDALGPRRCRVTMNAELRVRRSAVAAIPFLSLMLRRVGRITLADLRHYAETGAPSSLKQRALLQSADARTRVIRANAAFSATTGVAIAAGAAVLSPHLGGAPLALLFAVGGALLGFAAIVALLGWRGASARLAIVLAALDAAWVIGAVALLFAFGGGFTPGGYAAVVLTSAVVAVLAVLEWRLSRPQARPAVAQHA